MYNDSGRIEPVKIERESVVSVKRNLALGCGGLIGLWTASMLMMFVFSLIFGNGYQRMMDEDAERQQAQVAQVAHADQLWESGKKPDAVDAYTSLLYGTNTVWFTRSKFMDSELPRIYRRVIDHKIELGGSEAGRDDIMKALNNKVPLALSTSEANEFVAKLRQEYKREQEREQEAAVKRYELGNNLWVR